MNDIPSNNKPDNASRPGTARPRRADGKFMSRAEIAELEQLNNAVNELTPERFEKLNTEGKLESEVTVGEFISYVNGVMGGPLTNLTALRGSMTSRIGQHIDVEAKNTKSHTRRAKVKRVKDDDTKKPTIDRSTMFYQIRTLPNGRGYGLFYAYGIPLKHAIGGAYEKGQPLQHWFGNGGYQAMDPGAAAVFETAEAARKFRRSHFSVKVTDADTYAEIERNKRQVLGREWRKMGYRRRHPSHTTKNKNERKPRKVRDDLVKLYALIGRTH